MLQRYRGPSAAVDLRAWARRSILAQDDKTFLDQLRYSAFLVADCRKRRLQNVEAFVYLFVSRDQRDEDADYVRVGTGSNRDQAVLVTILSDLFRLVRGRSFIFLRLHQFDGLHSAEAAHITDDGPTTLPCAGTALEAVSEFVGAGQQIF